MKNAIAQLLMDTHLHAGTRYVQAVTLQDFPYCKNSPPINIAEGLLSIPTRQVRVLQCSKVMPFCRALL